MSSASLRRMSSVDPIDQIERSLVALRRSMSRRTLGRRMLEAAQEAYDLRMLETVDAVLSAQQESGSCTVGDVAQQLALDPSRASRGVARAVEAGLVVRVAAQHDARRVELELTERGWALEHRMQEVRREHARQRVSGWPEEELRRFGAALARFTGADEVTGVDPTPPSHG